MRESLIGAVFAGLSLALGVSGAQAKPQPAPLRLVATIPLPHVQGRNWNAHVDRLYVGVQAEGDSPAQIMGFEAQDY